VTASSIEKLVQTNDAARALGKTAKVHLKIDTGMERIGTDFLVSGSKNAFNWSACVEGRPQLELFHADQ
jgi:alanine racemase